MDETEGLGQAPICSSAWLGRGTPLMERRCSIGGHPLPATRKVPETNRAKTPTDHRTDGVEPAAAGYKRIMEQIQEPDEDAALRGEVRQSLALVGAFTFLVVAGMVIGLAL